MTTPFFTTLTQEGAEDRLSTVQETLSEIEASGITQLTAKDLQKELENNGMESHLFKAIQIFLENANMEGLSPTTYYDQHDKNGNPAGDLTIGIGLNLNVSTTPLALFYKAMPDVTWDKESTQPGHEGKIGILIDEHLPDKTYGDEFYNPDDKTNGLSTDQVYQMLYYTLIGAQNVPSETGKTYTYPGQINKLNSVLKKYQLDKQSFTPNQLIALLSLTYNRSSLFGKELAARLKDMLDSKNDGAVLLEMIECSNRNAQTCKSGVNGVQNRRLMEAALFHGDPKIVAMTTQQYNVLKKNCAGKGYDFAGIPNHYVLLGDYTNSDSPQPPVPGSSCHPNSTIYLGTNHQDHFGVDPNSGQQAYGGADKDTYTAKSTSSSPTVTLANKGDNPIFLSGDEDHDTYDLDQAGHVTISDSDGQGVIYNSKDVLNGFMFSTPTPDLYQFLGNATLGQYNLNLISSEYDQTINRKLCSHIHSSNPLF
ncbi:MAG: hypothetical protein EPO11_08890 [Gammaproteobacteria bacterium]|nr:MAG: hypothetical protein EPO11_08890 [Gammaproteobacteria bacterium]